MAKSKQSAALFEVIHSSKQYDRAGRGMLRTPKWWFKRKSASSSAPAPSITEPAAESGGGLASGAGGIRLHIDPDGQHITARFSYTATAVVLFTIGVLIVLAYMTGRKMTGASAPSSPLISTATAEEVRNQPTRPDVLDVRRSGPAIVPEEPLADDGTIAGVETTAPAPQWNDPRPPATLVVDGPNRNVGLNYVIVQSYAKSDRELAEQAVKLLKENGVDCTIEEGIKGWPNSLCVIGTRGFNRIRSEEYAAYEKKIQAVSKIFAPKGGWKAFKPIAKMWDREQ